jgi:energy-coupling factor transporter ATP-binding protein EcfA2
MRGVFCLHAGAARFGESVVAFTGLSGSGKSTLARIVEGTMPESAARVADDVFAAELQGDRVVARPHVLQPKVAPSAQPRLTQPERLPMAAVCVLPDPDESRVEPGDIAIERLAPADGVVALMRHSMAAVLFPPSTRRDHFDFCARAADAIPVYSLRYPWREDVVPELTERLAGLASR